MRNTKVILFIMLFKVTLFFIVFLQEQVSEILRHFRCCIQCFSRSRTLFVMVLALPSQVI